MAKALLARPQKLAVSTSSPTNGLVCVRLLGCDLTAPLDWLLAAFYADRFFEFVALEKLVSYVRDAVGRVGGVSDHQAGVRLRIAHGFQSWISRSRSAC